MERYKDFDIGDVYHHIAYDFYVYIFIDESKNVKIDEIKSLIEFFDGNLIPTSVQNLLMASNFKTKEQAEIFRETLIMENSDG
jgi:hypothetical protein